MRKLNLKWSRLIPALVGLCLMATTVTSFAGPGSGNGDTSEVLLAKIKASKGYNDFQSLVYAFDHGRKIDFSGQWKSVIKLYITKNSSGTEKLGGYRNPIKPVQIQFISRGTGLDPIWRVCFLDPNRGDLCSGDVIQTVSFSPSNALVLDPTEMKGGGEFKLFGKDNALIFLERAVDGKCESSRSGETIVPQDGICAVSNLELVQTY